MLNFINLGFLSTQGGFSPRRVDVLFYLPSGINSTNIAIPNTFCHWCVLSTLQLQNLLQNCLISQLH